MSTVGENIKIKRERLGLSQNKLAKRATIAQATLSAIESNTRSPSTETVALLAEALGCTVAELMGEAGSVPVLSAREKELLALFSQMNDTGQALLLSQAESILAQPALRQDAPTVSAM